MPLPTIQEQFGQIDIYLFDQLLKGRISPGMRILDAGCGSGRNLIYFLREGYEVYAVDPDLRAVESVRALARMFAPDLPESNFSVEAVEQMSFADAFADVVICNTVLHFARDDAQFESMLRGAWRVLKPGGLFFSRLGSSIGMESQIEHIAGRRYSNTFMFMYDYWYEYRIAFSSAITIAAAQRRMPSGLCNMPQIVWITLSIR